MENEYCLKALIESCSAAFLCRSKEDVNKLADMVEKIYPSYGSFVIDHGREVCGSRYDDGIGIRIDNLNEYTIDIGHARIDWYRDSCHRMIVDVNNLRDSSEKQDFGEIETDGINIAEFLFGVTKS